MNSDLDKKYAVGISFRSPDWATANELFRKLVCAPSLSVFYSEERQEEIAGRGVEKFRKVFSEETLLNVILLQETWGKTEATKAEMEGIISSAEAHHWNNLLVYRLDTSPLPLWYPNTNNYLSAPIQSIELLERAVRSKVDELRDSTSNLSLKERAALLAKERADEELRKRIMETGEGVTQIIQEFRTLCICISEHIKTLSTETSTQIACEYDQTNMVIYDFEYSYKLSLKLTGRPSLQDVHLKVESVNAKIGLPSQGRNFLGTPSISQVVRFEPDYVPHTGWVWKNKTKQEVKHTAAAAEWIVASFLNYLRPGVRKPAMSIYPFDN